MYFMCVFLEASPVERSSVDRPTSPHGESHAGIHVRTEDSGSLAAHDAVLRAALQSFVELLFRPYGPPAGSNERSKKRQLGEATSFEVLCVSPPHTYQKKNSRIGGF